MARSCVIKPWLVVRGKHQFRSVLAAQCAPGVLSIQASRCTHFEYLQYIVPVTVTGAVLLCQLG